MNICPVCRNVNEPEATACRYCQTALTPPRPAAEQPARRRLWPWLVGAAAVILLVGIGGLTFLGGGESAQATTEELPLSVGTGEGASLEFEPTSITAPPNAAIALTFNNQSTLPHNLTFQDGITAATSPNLEGGQSETIEFTTPGPGTYTYVCTIHPGMQGELAVQ